MAVSNSSQEVPLLSIRGLSKTFPGVKALDNVNLTLRKGEVHALMGENGAGKSTLIKVLTGVHRAEVSSQGGAIELDGHSIRPASPRDAEREGISTVYQEINLVPTLTVAENLCVGRFPRAGGLIRWGTTKKRARAALERVGMKLELGRQLSEYSLAIQQMVAIARALDTEAKLLILDEPTSSLDENEVDELFRVIAKLRDQGMGILFVTHFMDQVYRICDRITVLRNGTFVGEYPTENLPRMELIGKMVGKNVAALEQQEAEASSRHAHATTGDPAVEVKNLGRRGSISPVSFSIGKGQTVGLAGLLGSGRTEINRLLFGVDQADSGGSVSFEGREVRLRSPRQAMLHGFALTPEDRKAAGIIPNLSIRENIILALQSKRGICRRLSYEKQCELADDYIASLKIKTPDREQLVKNLSGGNQQKVLLARWLAVQPKLFILDEPTRGIDVGAKGEIEKLIVDLSSQGMSLLFVSSELEEVARVSQRVVVMRDRQQVGQLDGNAISEHAIINMIAKSTPEEGAA